MINKYNILKTVRYLVQAFVINISMEKSVLFKITLTDVHDFLIFKIGCQLDLLYGLQRWYSHSSASRPLSSVNEKDTGPGDWTLQDSLPSHQLPALDGPFQGHAGCQPAQGHASLPLSARDPGPRLERADPVPGSLPQRSAPQCPWPRHPDLCPCSGLGSPASPMRSCGGDRALDKESDQPPNR